MNPATEIEMALHAIHQTFAARLNRKIVREDYKANCVGARTAAQAHRLIDRSELYTTVDDEADLPRVVSKYVRFIARAADDDTDPTSEGQLALTAEALIPLAQKLDGAMRLAPAYPDAACRRAREIRREALALR